MFAGHLISRMQITYGSLFSGVGGFDLGCDKAGWKCEWQVEWDEKARNVLDYHWPDTQKYGDICGISGKDLTPVDVITFGFPCQDLSTAGKRAGIDGERSGLFFEATRVISEMRHTTGGKFPRIVIAENVRGLLSSDGGKAMGRCLNEMAIIGAVDIEWRILDAQYFGVPQRRRRVFIVASFNPRTTGSREILSNKESLSRNIAEVLETGQDTTTTAIRLSKTSSRTAAYVKARRAQNVDDFETWETDRPAPTLNAFDNLNETRATILAIPQTTGTITRNWSKGPGNTQVEEGLVQPTEAGPRRLTPLECERLQGWPDDHTRWNATGTENADRLRYRMIGNGVASPVAEWIATNISQELN